MVEGVTTNGKLLPGVYKLDASISSQYVSGLLLALPLLDGDSELVLEGNIVSKNYIDITKKEKELKIRNAVSNGYFTTSKTIKTIKDIKGKTIMKKDIISTNLNLIISDISK